MVITASHYGDGPTLWDLATGTKKGELKGMQDRLNVVALLATPDDKVRYTDTH